MPALAHCSPPLAGELYYTEPARTNFSRAFLGTSPGRTLPVVSSSARAAWVRAAGHAGLEDSHRCLGKQRAAAGFRQQPHLAREDGLLPNPAPAFQKNPERAAPRGGFTPCAGAEPDGFRDKIFAIDEQLATLGDFHRDHRPGM